MISVIVPVYNTEKYLKKCIDSILNQTYKNFELIIINDCSPDNSDKIIENYSDKRIRYYKNKINKGIGYNRNFAIDKSKGEYICFVDSDDYLREDFLEKMYSKSIKENLDMCVCDYIYFNNSSQRKFKLMEFETSNLNNNPRILIEVSLGPCNKMYRRKLIVDNNIKFSEDLKYEDVPFVAKSLYYSEKIGKINEYLNYFLTRENSETTVRDKRVFDILAQVINVREIYKEDKNEYLDDLISSILLNYTVQQRYQIDKNVADKFIDDSFKYLKDNHINYKKSIYIKNRPLYKRFIEVSKLRTKIYCDIYRIRHNKR